MVMGFGPMSMAPEFYDFCTSKNTMEDKKAKLQARMKNKVAHNIASTAVLAGGAVGIYNVAKHPDSKFVKKTGEYLTKGFNFVTGNCPEANTAIRNKVVDAKNMAEKHFKNVKIIKDSSPKFTGWVKKGISFIASKFKLSDKGVLGKVKQYAAEMAEKFAKVPASYKAAGAIAFLTGLAFMGISNHKSYKNGKIDQYYETKAQLCQNV
ncbi:MAG: hypothetical protein KHX03_04335 [Clostridium sp.]|nr:hypothetical protein [Clostridium sp.]